jgi:hypothetical protein
MDQFVLQKFFFVLDKVCLFVCLFVAKKMMLLIFLFYFAKCFNFSHPFNYLFVKFTNHFNNSICFCGLHMLIGG